MWIYLKYIVKYLTKKLTFWIVIFSYILVFSLICLVIPAISKAYFLWAWVSEFRSLNMMFEYLIALYAAILAIFIFRAPVDDGSELLICSKPINHSKLIASKFIIFVLGCAFYGLISALFACFGFLLPTNYWSIVSLIVSLFTVSFVFSLLFGGIAILISINHGKLWIISWNMVVVLLTNIIFFMGAVGLKEPAAAITNSKTTTPTQVSFVNRNNKQVKGEYFVSLSDSSISSLERFNLEWQKQVYQDGVKKSTTKAIYPIDITGHMYIMSNLGDLDYVRKQINGAQQIGQSNAFDYKINGLVHKYPNSSIDPIENDDDEYWKWTEFVSKDSPLFYTKYLRLKRADLARFVQINSQSSFDNLDEMFELLNSLLVNESTVFCSGIVGSSNNISNPINFSAPYTDTRFIFGYDDPWSREPTYSAGKFFNGSSATKNIVFMNPKLLEPSDIEKDLFDFLIYELMFNKDSDFYKDCFEKDNTYYHFNLKKYSNTSYDLIYKKIYEILCSENVNTKMNLKSEYDFALEIYKFKYYISRQLLGYYGIEDSMCTNWTNPEQGKIAVPYNNYFRLVFIPQYNSYTIRNIDEYSESIPITHDDFKLNPKEAFRYGLFVLPQLSSSNVNLLSLAFTNKNDGLKLASCEYDGNGEWTDLSELPDMYKIYDISKTDWTVSNKFGYFSELGLKLDTLLGEFAFKNSPIYADRGYTNLYGSEISSNSTQLLIYQHMLFTYSYNEIYSPYKLLVIYLIIDFIILSIGYVAHIRHDIK